MSYNWGGKRTDGFGSDGVFIYQRLHFKSLPQATAREALQQIAGGDYRWESTKPFDESWAIPAPVSNMHKPDASSFWIGKRNTMKRQIGKRLCFTLSKLDCSSILNIYAWGGWFLIVIWGPQFSKFFNLRECNSLIYPERNSLILSSLAR